MLLSAGAELSECENNYIVKKRGAKPLVQHPKGQYAVSDAGTACWHSLLACALQPCCVAWHCECVSCCGAVREFGRRVCACVSILAAGIVCQLSPTPWAVRLLLNCYQSCALKLCLQYHCLAAPNSVPCHSPYTVRLPGMRPSSQTVRLSAPLLRVRSGLPGKIAANIACWWIVGYIRRLS